LVQKGRRVSGFSSITFQYIIIMTGACPLLTRFDFTWRKSYLYVHKIYEEGFASLAEAFAR
jgi:hypothetical protein